MVSETQLPFSPVCLVLYLSLLLVPDPCVTMSNHCFFVKRNEQPTVESDDASDPDEHGQAEDVPRSED